MSFTVFFFFFFFNDTATTEIYTLSLHDALPISQGLVRLFESWCDWAKMDIRLDKCLSFGAVMLDKKFQQILPKINLKDKRSEEHTSELQSLAYLVCRLLLEKKKNETLSLTLRTI